MMTETSKPAYGLQVLNTVFLVPTYGSVLCQRLKGVHDDGREMIACLPIFLVLTYGSVWFQKMATMMEEKR
jgi:hypothetical protein